jgi:uncharacterized protein with HEPN domain
VSRNENRKTRILEMQEASERIIDYCKTLKSADEFASDRKTFDACIRNLQILGDAAKGIPPSIQSEFPHIPWRKIRGLRNVVVHEYFLTDPQIVWQTIERELPELNGNLNRLNAQLQSPAHPWKVCPPGEIFVKSADVDNYIRAGHPVSGHFRSEHCRTLNSSTKNILNHTEAQIISRLNFNRATGLPASDDLGFKKLGTQYDNAIAGWVQYWNEALNPDTPLTANIVKALIASESSFDSNAGTGKRNSAKGLMQLLPQTLRYLRGERGELKDHVFEIEDNDAFDPNLNIAAGIRWLHRKRETASARLERNATWEEAVAEYKDYLRRKLKNPKAKQKGMEVFENLYRRLQSAEKKGGPK